MNDARLRLAVAKACKAYADQLKAKNPRDPQIRKLLSDGRKLRHLCDAVSQRLSGSGPAAVARIRRRRCRDRRRGPMPKTFAEAKNAAKDSIDGMQTANLLLKTLPGADCDAQIAGDGRSCKSSSTRQSSNAIKGQADAMHYCRLALKLADSETSI